MYIALRHSPPDRWEGQKRILSNRKTSACGVRIVFKQRKCQNGFYQKREPPCGVRTGLKQKTRNHFYPQYAFYQTKKKPCAVRTGLNKQTLTKTHLYSKYICCLHPAFSLLSWWPRSGPTQHSHFYRGDRGVARLSIITSIGLAAGWLDPAVSVLSWWPRCGPTQHSHFHGGGRGVARLSILTSIVLAAEWPLRVTLPWVSMPPPLFDDFVLCWWCCPVGGFLVGVIFLLEFSCWCRFLVGMFLLVRFSCWQFLVGAVFLLAIPCWCDFFTGNSVFVGISQLVCVLGGGVLLLGP